MQHRSICIIAREITTDWNPVHYTAAPYVRAMYELESINDVVMSDSARSIVRYFLLNASTWRGAVAREIKSELRAML